jgi:hypothetical protein
MYSSLNKKKTEKKILFYVGHFLVEIKIMSRVNFLFYFNGHKKDVEKLINQGY